MMKRIAIALALGLIIPAWAKADLVKATIEGDKWYNGTTQLSGKVAGYDMTVWFKSQGTTTGFVGPLGFKTVWTSPSSGPLSLLKPSYVAYCIEGQDIGSGSYIWATDTLEDAPIPHNLGGSGIGPMSTHADLVRSLWLTHSGDVISNKTAAAMQMAIWELIYDGKTVDLNNGKFQAKAAWQDNASGDETGAITLAGTWANDAVTALGGYSYSDLHSKGLTALVNDGVQDFIVPIPGYTPPVPLPSAVWMSLPLLGGLWIARKMRA